MAKLHQVLPALLMSLLPALCLAEATAMSPGLACKSASQAINEEGFVEVGGIPQWLTIKGKHCSNPVVLIVHGGPGNTMSPYASAIYGAWEKDYTIVQWDQRGAGKTFGRNKPGEDTPLSIAQMADDGVAVATYLTQHLGKKKIILTGSSWGSILGAQMSISRPELFYAYVGTSQVVSYRANQTSSYNKVLNLAQAAGDQETVSKVSALGPPPWSNPRNFGVLRKAIRKYEALSTDPAPKTWWSAEPAYATPAALADYEAGEDYSFLKFVGYKGDGMFSTVDFPETASKFAIPVFFVQGAEDLLTMPEITRQYVDSITAPQKEYILVPRAGHDPNLPFIEAQLKLLNERVRALSN
ncbi:alpha/beta fold hydrolase [Undibacterium sp. Di27W]|uniref:alpha/beta fold hydrolase n=1 Tax=Undibacterium sp. Di27W TaxID=3413036 RepID=UPI003BF25843